MYSGRISGDFLDPEPGYYNQSAYNGEKDILSLGVGAQYQKGGSVLVIPAAMPDLEVGDLKVFTIDALFDKKLPGNHVVTVEGNYYHTDDFQPVTRMYVLSAGYTSPPVGPGRLSPSLRFQRGAVTPPIYDPVAMTGLRDVGLDREFTQIDGYVQYLIKSHFAKVMVGGFWNKTRLKSNGDTAYAKGIQFGLQVIAL